MYPIGLIIGHGYAKAVSPDATIVLPAVAAPAVASDFETTLGAARSAIAVDGQDWIVGEDALRFAPNRLVSILDRTRYWSPAFVAVAQAALRQLRPPPAPLRVLTGMPSSWFADAAARAQLAAAVRQAAQPLGGAHVTVAPEAAGVYYAWLFAGGALDPARLAQTVGVVDCGYRDVNVAWFSGGRYAGGDSVPGGAHEGLKEIRRLVSQVYGMELSLHEVDAAARAGAVLVAGKERPLPAGSAAALTRNLGAVLAMGRSLWPNGGQGLHAVLLGGGGAPHLQAGLTRELPQLCVLPDPQVAGARGFAAMAAASAQAGR